MGYKESIWRGTVSMGPSKPSILGSILLPDRGALVEDVKRCSRWIGQVHNGIELKIIPLAVYGRFRMEGVREKPDNEIRELAPLAVEYIDHPEGLFKVRYSFWLRKNIGLPNLIEALAHASKTTSMGSVSVDIEVLVEEYNGDSSEELPITV